MRRSSILPQLLIGLAATLSLMMSAPFVHAQISDMGLHTYLIRVQGEDAPFEVRAERVSRHTNGMVTLESNGQTVAVFNGYQLLYMVQDLDRAETEFEVKTHDGEVRRFKADRMRVDAQGLVEFESAGHVSGLIWNNNVRYVVAVLATN